MTYSSSIPLISHSLRGSRAFTLVETLVAIAILMISVSGPLAVANKALTAALYAKDQSTASFLAQEEMEIIKNVKGNNIIQGGGQSNQWLGSVLSSCNGKCDITVSSSGSFNKINNRSSSYPLYVDSQYNYNHDGNGTKTIFSRYFSLTEVGGNNCNPSSSECQVTVIVSWNEGTVSNAVTLSSEILNVAP
jgi:type II secretory pathway pseudopilin PulG